MPLVQGECGRADAFVCPYHGWRYGLDGALDEAPYAAEGFDCDKHGLFALRAETWAGFVFVTAAADVPPLASFLGDVPPWLVEAPLSLLERAHRSSWEVAANWKLVVENFQESHHFPRVHPGLESLTPTSRASTWFGEGPWLGGTMELAGAAETVSTTGLLRGRPVIVGPGRARRVHDALLFPAMLTSLQPDYLLTYRLVPRGPASTIVVADVLLHPAAPAGSADEVIAFWAATNAEDRAACERQQLGLRTRGFESAGYVTVEEGVHAFDVMVARALAGVP
jgi:Rieske 2Fe-2S family protein